MYAVVAPGLKGIYRDSKALNDLLAIYPYARFKKCRDEAECYQWINANISTRVLEELHDYGDALPQCHIKMSYYLRDNFLYVNYDTKKFGKMRISIDDPDIILTQAPNFCSVKVPFNIQAKPVQRNLLAIQRALRIIGDMVDVVVIVPDHSVFYALRSYTGEDKLVRRVQQYVRDRQGGTSISLKR